MPLPRSILITLLALLAWVSVAQAQPPAVVPPRAKDAPAVPYPEGAEGDAVVILVLVVDVDGSVRSAEVAAGEEPFASAARQAATAWRFSPATRNAEPVAAKISFRVAFEEQLLPEPAPEPDAEPEPEPEASPASVTAGPPEEAGSIDVVVEGTKVVQPPSVSSFTRAEVRQLPGAFGDPFRAIEVLPGVTPIISGLPFFYVRGAPPGNIGYFLDGVRVPYLFHLGAGPSVVHPAMVERVDLYSGGYPARFGRYAGAIVAAETTEPRADWRGEGVLRLVDVGALVEGGFADGRGTALLGGRIGWPGVIASLISDEITLDYRDYQARVSYDITDRDRISLFAFGSYDYLSETREVRNQTTGTTEEVENALFGTEFYRVDGRYDVRLPGGGALRAAMTFGYDQTRIFGTRRTQNMIIGSRVRVARPLSDEVTLRGGFDMQIDHYTADELPWSDPDSPFTQDFNSLFPARSEMGVAGWTDVVVKLNETLEITPGLRLDTYLSKGEKAMALDPRLAVVAHVDEDVRILHAVGLATQPPSFAVPIPGLAVASLAGGLQRSVQASSGLEVDLPLKITATVTGFAGAYLEMTDSIGAQQDPTELEGIPRSLGSAKGIEIYVRRSLSERLGGFVSYTLSRTTRSVGGERFLATFDRPHVLHTAVGYKLGRGWSAGLRFSLYSGTLHEEQSTDDPESFELVRDPVFYRFDGRLEKRWSILDDDAWISLVFETVNLTLNKEPIGGSRFGPVFIPSVGLEGGF